MAVDWRVAAPVQAFPPSENKNKVMLGRVALRFLDLAVAAITARTSPLSSERNCHQLSVFSRESGRRAILPCGKEEIACVVLFSPQRLSSP
jgi:hypothetical protein